MNPTSKLLSRDAIAARLNITVGMMRTFLRKGLFPEADARIGRRCGWDAGRVDQFADEDLAVMHMHVQRRHDPFVPNSHPKWWEVGTLRYIGLPELAEAAVLSPSAVWSHYYNGKLPVPDITIGHVKHIAGWLPANAKRLAEAQGWRLDLARLDDTSDLAGEL